MAATFAGSRYSCGLDAAVSVVGGKWKPLILWQLHYGAKRHGELRRSIGGVSEKVLTQQLRELQSHGIVGREVFAEVPPRVEYSLTDLGQSLNDALRALGDWGEKHAEHIIGLSAET